MTDTDPLYLADSSVRTFEATVERAFDDGRLVLDRTHFYPEGGGQPADGGRIRLAETTEDGAGHAEGVDDGGASTAAWTVRDVQKRDRIYHELESAGDGTDSTFTDALAPGTTVVGELDWGRRYAHMRYHTAQHLLSAHLLEVYDAPTTGNQLYHDRARLDCAYDRFEADDLQAIEDAINGYVDAALPVRWYDLDRETAESRLDLERTRIDLLPDSITVVRIVEVGDEADPLDRVACAGTHVDSTAALGRFEITGRETAGDGEERVRFRLAD